MKILVLLGGQSAERHVSYATGIAVARALARGGHRVAGLDPGNETWHEGSTWYENDGLITEAPPAASSHDPQSLVRSLGNSRIREFDTVFIGLHGGAGEDGTVQTLLGLIGATYTGSGPLSSGVAMHKDTSKRLFRQAKIPTPDWVFPVQQRSEDVEFLGRPLIIKPVAEGSTVGLSLVKDAADLPAAIEKAGIHVMAEMYIPGRELAVGVVGDSALPPVEILPDHEIYDYECKYTDGKCEYKCPAPISAALDAQIRDIALRAHRVLGCSGLTRVDFRVSPDNTPYCLEVNTLPGMTSHSLVPIAAKAAGLNFESLCERVCDLAQRYPH